MKTFVVAGNYNQAMHWIETQCKKRLVAGDTSVSMSEYVVMDKPEKARGYSDPHGVFVGNWRELENIEEIVETLFLQSHYVNPQLQKIRNEVRSK